MANTSIINTGEQPTVATGFKIKKHTGVGVIDVARGTSLYISPKQQNAAVTDGHEVLLSVQETSYGNAANATVLDAFLENPEIIPPMCKTEMEEHPIPDTFFWNTTYEDSGGREYVRYLHYDKEGKPQSGYKCLDDKFSLLHVALLVQ